MRSYLGRNYKIEYDWDYFVAATIKMIILRWAIIRMIMVRVLDQPQLKSEI